MVFGFIFINFFLPDDQEVILNENSAVFLVNFPEGCGLFTGHNPSPGGAGRLTASQNLNK